MYMHVGTKAGAFCDSPKQTGLAVELPRLPKVVSKDEALILI